MPSWLKWGIIIVLVIITIGVLSLVVKCGGSALPTQAGEYGIQPKSLTYDGEDYAFRWIDTDASVHPARTAHLKMVLDERTFLEVTGQGETPVLHLTTEDPIIIKGEDDDGAFDTPWFPFLAGTVIGSSLSDPYPGTPLFGDRTPTYRYPPTSAFGRSDTMHGNVTSDKPVVPDYKRVPSNPKAVSGTSGGTGGGTAVTGKTGTVGATGGASGGTGAGSAATKKSGFTSGSSSISGKTSSTAPKVGGGSGKSSSTSSSSSRSTSSSSRGSSGGRSGAK
jgi:hypothetical protein